MGGFNAELLSNFRSGFCESYNLNLLKPNLIEESACFKNPGNSTCIDLILTNRQNFSKFYHYRKRVILLSFTVFKLLQET